MFTNYYKQYEIRSSPQEPCTYICDGDKIVHTLRAGFETSKIEKMIMRGKEFRSVNGNMIDLDLMMEILAAAIRDGRSTMQFDDAETLALERREKRRSAADQSCSQSAKPETKKVIQIGDTEHDVYLGNWPHYHHYAGELVTLKLNKDPNKNIVITETDIQLHKLVETEKTLAYRFVMPDRDVHIDYKYVQIFLKCSACGKEYEMGEDVCPHCQALLHEYASEVKSWRDMICDGVLAWGVEVGRFVFEKYGKIVYAITDTPHVGPSDVVVCYQISRADYEHLLAMSMQHAIPDPPVSPTITNKYHDVFLCSQSAYAKRYKFTLRDVDKSLLDEK